MAMLVYWMIWSVWFQVCFLLYVSVFSMSWYGYRYLWHCTLVSSTPWLYSQSDWFLGVRCSSGECHQVLLINNLLIYTLIFFYISNSGSANTQLPGCFCPWTFSLNSGLSMFPLDSFMSCLNSLLGYSTGEFQALQLIVLAAFGVVD